LCSVNHSMPWRTGSMPRPTRTRPVSAAQIRADAGKAQEFADSVALAGVLELEAAYSPERPSSQLDAGHLDLHPARGSRLEKRSDLVLDVSPALDVGVSFEGSGQASEPAGDVEGGLVLGELAGGGIASNSRACLRIMSADAPLGATRRPEVDAEFCGQRRRPTRHIGASAPM
jgi:hypothetical protein